MARQVRLAQELAEARETQSNADKALRRIYDDWCLDGKVNIDHNNYINSVELDAGYALRVRLSAAPFSRETVDSVVAQAGKDGFRAYLGGGDGYLIIVDDAAYENHKSEMELVKRVVACPDPGTQRVVRPGRDILLGGMVKIIVDGLKETSEHLKALLTETAENTDSLENVRLEIERIGTSEPLREVRDSVTTKVLVVMMSITWMLLLARAF